MEKYIKKIPVRTRVMILVVLFYADFVSDVINSRTLFGLMVGRASLGVVSCTAESCNKGECTVLIEDAASYEWGWGLPQYVPCSEISPRHAQTGTLCGGNRDQPLFREMNAGLNGATVWPALLDAKKHLLIDELFRVMISIRVIFHLLSGWERMLYGANLHAKRGIVSQSPKLRIPIYFLSS